MRSYFVYILASDINGTLYVGITNNLERRLLEHKRHMHKGFTDKYNVTQLVYFEEAHSIDDALNREKKLKKWPRRWKTDLINEYNPTWRDLADEYRLDSGSSPE